MMAQDRQTPQKPQKEALSGISIVLPSLDPDEKLTAVIDGMLSAGFSDILLVNDGSKKENLHFFEEAARLHPEVTVLTHPENLGKGAALKTAFSYFLVNRPDFAGVVTVDGDNQHRPEDTAACALRMLECGKVVLGARNFDLPGVPARSKKGNHITSAVFKIFCGMTVSDTQTGLRAIPRKHLEAIAKVKGDRFEYETNMLLEMKQQDIPFEEVKICTVYIEENKSSHFRVVRDSVRIYRLILGHFIKYSASSFLCSLVEILLYSQITRLLHDSLTLSSAVLTASATIPSRILSSILNFFLNKKLVFEKKGENGVALLRYYILVIVQMLAQLFFTEGTYFLLDIGESRTVVRTVIYTTVMILLFFFSYFAQQNWVFKHKIKKSKNEKKN